MPAAAAVRRHFVTDTDVQSVRQWKRDLCVDLLEPAVKNQRSEAFRSSFGFGLQCDGPEQREPGMERFHTGSEQ
ncbi:hypothetical protein INR49_011570 [Caranx melampygus]|nr:hypothetical protein INR49_011570 [Caranx melampygus]